MLFVLTQRHGNINMPSVVFGVSLTCLVVVRGEKCFLGERRASVLFTFNSLTGLREEKAGYGRLGSSPCSQIRFVSHEKKLSVDSLNRWFSLKKEAYEELAEFSLSQGH